jgi:ABC-type branched-subunit amino acid transport system ATPase component
MSETVTAYGGAQVPINDLEVVIGRNGSGQVTTLTYIYQGITYIQTITYTGASASDISQLIPQTMLNGRLVPMVLDENGKFVASQLA